VAVASFAAAGVAIPLVGLAEPVAAHPAAAPGETDHVTPRADGAGVRTIKATAYCLDGRMANGEETHDGAAAMRGVPLGASVAILDGPDAGMTLVVKDRTPKAGMLDIWMADCRAAIEHGVREVTIEVRV
jgi:3D (Asp-Asp-Asp) domain-containing protein